MGGPNKLRGGVIEISKINKRGAPFIKYPRVLNQRYSQSSPKSIYRLDMVVAFISCGTLGADILLTRIYYLCIYSI